MRKQEKNLTRRCFCGQIVVLLQSGTLNNPGRWFLRCPMWKTMDCKYFVWVDEIDGGWEGLARALVGTAYEKTSVIGEDNKDVAQLGGMREIDMKMRKIVGKIKSIRLWVIVNFFLPTVMYRDQYYAIDGEVETRVPHA
ncbi:hypothetical protein PIB30_022420 [Stylosanthes scabra]|uniref:GRF-type domain-containing protein n=1 Tax=Stylosanthes scabra TaxID=79078 RepID=A0ABU6Q9M5_9FABA|nr:hypothetical protein [Stylosanthes scabra]